MNRFKLFLLSAEQLSQTASQSSTDRITVKYNCSDDFLLTINFSVRIRFSRT